MYLSMVAYLVITQFANLAQDYTACETSMRALCLLHDYTACEMSVSNATILDYIVIFSFKYVIDKRNHSEFDLPPTCCTQSQVASINRAGISPPFCKNFPLFYHPIVK